MACDGLLSVGWAFKPASRCLPEQFYSPAARSAISDSSSEVIRLVAILNARFSLWLRNVEDLLSNATIELCHERVRISMNRFGPTFAGDLRQLVRGVRGFR